MNVRRSPFAFFGLVFALSLPFWVAGAVAPLELLPALPIGALMAVSPLIAASALIYRVAGTAGLGTWLRRDVDYHGVRPAWYLPALLLMPAVSVTAYEILRARGSPLPEPNISVLPAVALFLGFLALGFAEEAGWSGYATGPLQDRWGALSAGITIGIVWAVWHIVPLIQARRPADWIAWWALGTVCSRIIIVWLYNGTGGSVLAATLYHAMINLCWQLFPDRGSHYDPRVTTLLLLPIASAIALRWGVPRSLRGGR